MGTLAVGDVILVPFPYSNLEAVKKRPALIAGTAEQGDLILCQITSRSFASSQAIALDNADFVTGGLERESYARPDKLFTADPSIAIRKLGRLQKPAIRQVRRSVARLFTDVVR